ncbi:transcription factor DIVARICATA-like [Malania oleifera]|uniref:transcription factor DIVARICATA-like n=1 Tax=Malania oleifera TaxID=397392 RepID=UPI0025AE6CD6|nr:transcription factor DIVARICATA-like [Malania oleifera]
METLRSASYMANSNWLVHHCINTEWTREENKQFESALAIYDQNTPDRWFKIADMIPGKSVFDVMKQYQVLEDDVRDIEAGLVPFPGDLTASFTMELIDNHSFDAFRKKTTQERKKGVPWTEDEHRRFLKGLLKYGKGDWRNISRNFVISKTPTQVASHAQKYFLRQQASGGKDKKRPSIHDITTLNLAETTPSDSSKPHLQYQHTVLPPQQRSTSTPEGLLNWDQSNDQALMVFDSAHGNLFVPSQFEVASHGLKMQGKKPNGGTLHGDHIGAYDSDFQIQSTRHPVRG